MPLAHLQAAQQRAATQQRLFAWLLGGIGLGCPIACDSGAAFSFLAVQRGCIARAASRASSALSKPITLRGTPVLQRLPSASGMAFFKKATNTILSIPEIEVKVKEATNNEPWGPSGSQMTDISRATHN